MCLIVFNELVKERAIMNKIFERWIAKRYSDSTVTMKDIQGEYSCTTIKSMWAAFCVGVMIGEELSKRKQKKIS